MAAELLERRRESPHSLSAGRRHTPSVLNSSFTSLAIEEVIIKCQECSTENHTHLFSPGACSDQSLLTRRGNTLVLKILTTAPISAAYVVSLTFVPCHRPRERFAQFRARGVAHDSCTVWLSIAMPTNFPVGKYHTQVTLTHNGEVVTHFSRQPIAVLFDPWNQDDECYVSEKDRDCYLLANVGDIARGTTQHKTTLKWEYGQFDDNILDVALSLISSLSADECRSPVGVSREVVSRIVTRDNTGVLLKGSGATGAVHPCRWNGSTLILQKYHRTGTPVRYGQCWVFAGVTVSLLRALGVAARPTTCYNAAHRTSKPGVVERHFTREGELAQDLSTDRLWVYHVWVEGWMRRPDLGGDSTAYNGWQVLDPTPQHRQSGRYRIGPVSVNAIREKKSFPKRGYGTQFIVSEVTAFTKYLRTAGSRLVSKQFTLAHTRKDEVATEIVTMGTDNKTNAAILLDVTSDYRVPPTPTHTRTPHFPHQSRDCSFQVSCQPVPLGEVITVVTRITNEGALQRSVDGRVVCYVMAYTGRLVRRFANMTFTGVVAPGQSATVGLPLVSRQYLAVLTEQAIMLFFVAVKVRENGQLFLKCHPYQLVLPSVVIEAPERLIVGEALRLKLSFKNVLSSSLSRVLFTVQAGRLLPQRELSSKRLVLPGGVVCVECTVQCVQCPPGEYSILASMHSDKLTDVHGHTTISIVANTSLV